MKIGRAKRIAAAVVLAAAATVAGVENSGHGVNAKAKTTVTTHLNPHLCACHPVSPAS